MNPVNLAELASTTITRRVRANLPPDTDPNAEAIVLHLATHAATLVSIAGFVRNGTLNASTIRSAFLRHGLPSPSRLLIDLKLWLAAEIKAVSPTLTVGQVALEAGYSSGQHFSRHVQHQRRMPAARWLATPKRNEIEAKRFLRWHLLTAPERWRHVFGNGTAP